MDIEEIKAVDLIDSTQAAEVLRVRFNRKSYSVEAVRTLVEMGKLRVFYYDGTLKMREENEKKQGKNWLFLRSDLEALEIPKRGRRWK